MSAPLSDELGDLQAVIRRFVDDEVEPRAMEIEQTGVVPEDLRAKAASLGLPGLSIPETYGGIGTNELTTVVALEALAHGPGGPTFVMGPNAVSAALLAAGTDQQRQQLLPAIASGEQLASFCLTEEGAGSDAAAIRTSAERVDDGWRITGTKLYITRARHAGLFLVSAVTERREDRNAVTLFLVHKEQGVQIGSPDEQVGLRGSGSAEVVFDGVVVPDDQVLGGVGEGFDVLKQVLASARLWAAARAVGASSRCLELALEHTATRHQFGQPLSSFQAVKLRIADMTTQLAASRMLLRHAAETVDAGEDGAYEASVAKLVCTENATHIADATVQLHGAMGVSREHIVERFYRDVRAYRILDGTSDIQRLLISRRLRQHGVGTAVVPGGAR